jgi:hypothetical protein
VPRPLAAPVIGLSCWAVLPPVCPALPLELAALPLASGGSAAQYHLCRAALDFMQGTVLPPVFCGSAVEDAPTVRIC